jgi:hypothetical protein
MQHFFQKQGMVENRNKKEERGQEHECTPIASRNFKGSAWDVITSTTTFTPCSQISAIASKPYLQAVFLLFFHIPSISRYSAACQLVSLKQIAQVQGISDHIQTFIS